LFFFLQFFSFTFFFFFFPPPQKQKKNMPALVALGRRWAVASDDLAIPLALAASARIVWIILCAVALNALQRVHSSDCAALAGALPEDRAFLVTALALFSLSVLVDLLGVRASGRGTALEPEVRYRAGLRPLLAISLVLMVLEVCANGYGSYLAWTTDTAPRLADNADSSRGGDGCDLAMVASRLRMYRHTVTVEVVWGWAHLLWTLFGVWYAWDPTGRADGSRADFEAHVTVHRTGRDYERGWEKRCERLFCCSRAKRHDPRAFTEIAPLFSHLFRGVDLVTSDVITGMMLLEARQNDDDRRRRVRLHSVESDDAGGGGGGGGGTVATTTTTLATATTTTMTTTAAAAAAAASEAGAHFHGLHPRDDAHLEQRMPESQKSPQRNQTIAQHEAELLRELADPQTPSGRVPYRDLAEMDHYMPYAFAVYGWMLHVFDSPCTAPCAIVCRGGGCGCACLAPTVPRAGAEPLSADGDACGSPNLASFAAQFRDRIGTGEVELVHMACHNPLYLSPYFVALDHKAKSLVITLRGTLSLVDAIADANAEEEVIRVPGLDGDCYAHRGMVRIALKVRAQLANDAIIERLVAGFAASTSSAATGTSSSSSSSSSSAASSSSSSSSSSSAPLHQQQPRYPGYRIVLAGHSLGAGTASILLLLLLGERPDLNIHCYAYSPPAAVLCARAAQAVSPWVTSIVLGASVADVFFSFFFFFFFFFLTFLTNFFL
jgi:hypothetical protein